MSSFHLSELDSSFGSSKGLDRSGRTLDETMAAQVATEDRFEFDYLQTTHQVNSVRSDLKFLGGKAHRYAKNSGLADDNFEHDWPTPKPVRFPARNNTTSLHQSQASCRGESQTEFFRTTPIRKIRS